MNSLLILTSIIVGVVAGLYWILVLFARRVQKRYDSYIASNLMEDFWVFWEFTSDEWNFF